MVEFVISGTCWIQQGEAEKKPVTKGWNLTDLPWMQANIGKVQSLRIKGSASFLVIMVSVQVGPVPQNKKFYSPQ